MFLNLNPWTLKEHFAELAEPESPRSTTRKWAQKLRYVPANIVPEHTLSG